MSVIAAITTLTGKRFRICHPHTNVAQSLLSQENNNLKNLHQAA